MIAIAEAETVVVEASAAEMAVDIAVASRAVSVATTASRKATLAVSARTLLAPSRATTVVVKAIYLEIARSPERSVPHETASPVTSPVIFPAIARPALRAVTDTTTNRLPAFGG